MIIFLWCLFSLRWWCHAPSFHYAKHFHMVFPFMQVLFFLFTCILKYLDLNLVSLWRFTTWTGNTQVLFFSTMTRLLDVMEEYLTWKQYRYLRLDGHTSGSERGSLIDHFNQPDSPYFIFLLRYSMFQYSWYLYLGIQWTRFSLFDIFSQVINVLYVLEI